ncbi:hypothetical protein ABBQ32_010437 [Trebouxia sp. C0010 RCD-2024]
MPARDQDWQIHSAGFSHQSQLLSLCCTGEPGHVPLGANFTSDVRFTQQQLQYFGCQDRERLSALQLEAMMAVVRWAGAASSRRVAPVYWNLHTDWAVVAMRIAMLSRKKTES